MEFIKVKLRHILYQMQKAGYKDTWEPKDVDRMELRDIEFLVADYEKEYPFFFENTDALMVFMAIHDIGPHDEWWFIVRSEPNTKFKNFYEFNHEG